MNQDLKMLVGIGLATIILVVGAVVLLSGSSKPSTSSQQPQKVDEKLLVRPDSHKISTDSAKVSVVEFADFQCPACGVAYPITKKVLEDYKGKINYVFRHFPLPQHQNGMKAAIATEAAGEQGKFWEMYDVLFSKQDEWSPLQDPSEQFVNYAKDLGLNTDKFKQDLTGNKYAARIKEDQDDGFAVGIDATPTFFVDGQKLSDFSYEEFKSRIDSELSK